MSSNNAIVGCSYKRIVADKLTTNYRETRIETTRVPEKLPKDQVVVAVEFMGINASDVNYTAGRYDPKARPPLYPGFEAIGTIIAKGEDVKDLNIGDSVAIASGFGCFSELIVIHWRRVLRIPFVSAQVLPLLVSGLTAAIGLEDVAQMKSGETVLVTAAAGGTGQFAVQLAKLAGNHVIGTCSSDDKVEFLKKLGCDRVINYKKENLFKVLKSEYPKGIDIVYESVGGEFFDTCVNNLAVKGRLIIIGFISGYRDQTGWTSGSDKKQGASLSSKLLGKSASIRGCFLNHYTSEFRKHMKNLSTLLQEGKLESKVDDTKSFVGLEQVPDAIEYMYQGKNIGKVVVQLPKFSATQTPPSKL